MQTSQSIMISIQGLFTLFILGTLLDYYKGGGWNWIIIPLGCIPFMIVFIVSTAYINVKLDKFQKEH